MKWTMNLRIIFLIFTVCKLADSYSQEDKQFKITDDIDKDGSKDYVVVTKSIGKSSEFFEMKFVMSNRREEIIVSAEYNYSSFISIIPLPNEIEVKSISFLRELSMRLYGVNYQVGITPEVRWLVDVAKNASEKILNEAVDFKSAFTIRWVHKKPNVYKKFSTLIDDTIAKYIIEHFGVEKEEKKYRKYLIAYFGNNHQKVSCDSINPKPHLQLCNTNHGVLLVRDNRYSWIFINDLALFGFGSEKLRWPSLTSTKVHNKFVIINIFSGVLESNVLYIIDIDSGQLVRLNNQFLGIKQIQNYEVIDEVLHIVSSGNKVTIPLKQLFN